MHCAANALVLALIALVGGGLLLVGIVRVRESFRQEECTSNLRTLGLALHNHESAEKHFPSWHGGEQEPAP